MTWGKMDLWQNDLFTSQAIDSGVYNYVKIIWLVFMNSGLSLFK